MFRASIFNESLPQIFNASLVTTSQGSSQRKLNPTPATINTSCLRQLASLTHRLAKVFPKFWLFLPTCAFVSVAAPDGGYQEEAGDRGRRRLREDLPPHRVQQRPVPRGVRSHRVWELRGRHRGGRQTGGQSCMFGCFFFFLGSLFFSSRFLYTQSVQKRVSIQAIGQRNSSFPQSISWESKNLLAMFEGFF